MRILGLLFVLAGLAMPALAQEQRVTGTCRICGGTTYGMRRELVTGNIRYTTIGRIEAPALCQRCTVDVQAGRIDARNPPALAPRDDEHEDDVLVNPWAPKEDPLEVAKRERANQPKDEEAHSGFGALTWIVGIVAAVGLLLRWFLKS